jgi:hypothetical protein
MLVFWGVFEYWKLEVKLSKSNIGDRQIQRKRLFYKKLANANV